jgi:hypothetical protein
VFRAENDTTLTNADLTQIILNTLQRTPNKNGVPRQWDSKFEVYTPFVDSSEIGKARTAFESTLPNKRSTPMVGEDSEELAARRAALTTMLDSTSYDIAHFAASTRAYLQWGTSGGSPETQIGDLGAWALDLVQAWNAYEAARIAGYTGGAYTWLKARIGAATPEADASGFGYSDLIADIDAYLAAINILDNYDGTRNNPKATLATTMRNTWANAATDPKYRRRTFTNIRFNANPETAKQAVRHLFTAGWEQLWVRFPVEGFLKVRRPGETELNQVADAFAHVLFTDL